MSAINTNSINTAYPIPGINNSSQGFRDNFTSVKVNLDVAANEITDLQNKAVLKSALANTNGVINNDMANTLISNASTRSFRNTTYNLGNALSGTVNINASVADLFYGSVSNNISLRFNSWAPTNTQQIIYLNLNIGNTSAIINFPQEAYYAGNNSGLAQTQNYMGNGNVSVPYGITQLNYRISTVDCGNTLYIEPVNREYQSVQIETRSPPPTGQQGDVTGTVCVDAEVAQLNISNTTVTSNVLTTANTATLSSGMPVTFTGTTFGGINDNTTYYIRNVVSNTTFTVASTSALSANVALSTANGTMYLNPVSYMYIATGDYSATKFNLNISQTVAPNTIIIDNAGAVGNANIFALNQPVIFANVATSNTIGIQADTVYYVKSMDTPNNSITLSETRYSGVAGPEFQGIVSKTANVNVILPDMDMYRGPDIWRRIPLNPW